MIILHVLKSTILNILFLVCYPFLVIGRKLYVSHFFKKLDTVVRPKLQQMCLSPDISQDLFERIVEFYDERNDEDHPIMLGCMKSSLFSIYKGFHHNPKFMNDLIRSLMINMLMNEVIKNKIPKVIATDKRVVIDLVYKMVKATLEERGNTIQDQLATKLENKFPDVTYNEQTFNMSYTLTSKMHELMHFGMDEDD
jgi:hypothetical protein